MVGTRRAPRPYGKTAFTGRLFVDIAKDVHGGAAADAETRVIDGHQQGFAITQHFHDGALADTQIAQTRGFGFTAIESQDAGGLAHSGAAQRIAVQVMMSRVSVVVNTALAQNSFDHVRCFDPNRQICNPTTTIGFNFSEAFHRMQDGYGFFFCII